jgi:hypothetical protein
MPFNNYYSPDEHQQNSDPYNGMKGSQTSSSLRNAAIQQRPQGGGGNDPYSGSLSRPSRTRSRGFPAPVGSAASTVPRLAVLASQRPFPARPATSAVILASSVQSSLPRKIRAVTCRRSWQPLAVLRPVVATTAR